MHVVIVGHGMIGAAAARHLGLAGHRVTLIGPPEPADKASHQGPFASHYDAGRIARILDATTLWTRIKAASMTRFGEIEAAGGERFFHASGAMMAGPKDGHLMKKSLKARDALGIAAEWLDGGALAARFPFFRFPAGSAALYEAQSGWLDPRAMIRAQTAAAEQLGCMVIPEVVTDLKETASGVQVTTPSRRIGADHAILATGAFVRDLTARDLEIETYARTVLFLEVDAAEAERLARMPTVVIEARSGREPYLLPPIRYPDGGLWIKIGGDPVDIPLAKDELGPWFRTAGKPEVAAHHRAILDALMPDLRVLQTRTEACVVTFTPHDRPLIDKLSSHITIATAGCARGAKASDELGRIAVETVFGRRWPELAGLKPA